jgi:hypothetical protein
VKVQSFLLGLLLFVIGLAGCVHIPKEAVQLSSEIGTRIAESKVAHIALVRQYMAEKRERIDEFIFNEWVPVFADQVFKKEAIANAWEEIVKSDDKVARLKFITDLGVRLQQRINAKRKELMQPINEMEQLLLARINEHYDEMMAANATLTAFLDSSSKAKERQQRVLKMLRIEDSLSKFMTAADRVVEKIIEARNAFKDNRESIERIIDNLRRE